jgi:hypothetical protein
VRERGRGDRELDAVEGGGDRLVAADDTSYAFAAGEEIFRT